MHYGRLLRFLALLGIYIYLSPKDNPLDKVLAKHAKKIIKIVEKGIKGKKVKVVLTSPVLDINDDLILKEQSIAKITTKNLNSFDRDSADFEIIYKIRNVPQYGNLYLGRKRLKRNSAFTQEDLRAGRVRYKHSGESVYRDLFEFTLQDSDGRYAKNANLKRPGVFNFIIEPVNDRPRLVANQGAVVKEQLGIRITSNLLNTTDNDNVESEIVYTIVDLPKYGVLAKDKRKIEKGDKFTQSDLTQGKIIYVHKSESNEEDHFKFTVSDPKMGSLQANPSGPASFDIKVLPVNDAPRLLFAKTKKVKEQGKTIVDSNFLKAEDIDNSDEEVEFVISNLPRRGNIYKDGKKLKVGDSFTQDELSDNAIVYLHDGSDSRVDKFQFFVRDSSLTSAENAGVKNPVDFKFSIIPVNDNPRLQLNNKAVVNQYSRVILKDSNLKTRDVDNTEGEILYKLVSSPKRGELKLNNSVLGTDDYFTQSDIDNGFVAYEHDDDSPVRDEFSFSVSDKDGGFSKKATDNNPATFVFEVNKADLPKISRKRKIEDPFPSLSLILGKVGFGGAYQNLRAVGSNLTGNFREAVEIGASFRTKMTPYIGLEAGLIQRQTSVAKIDTSAGGAAEETQSTINGYVRGQTTFESWNFGLEFAFKNHGLISYSDTAGFLYIGKTVPVLGLEVINSKIISLFDFIFSMRLGAEIYKGTNFANNVVSDNSLKLKSVFAVERIIGNYSFNPELIFSTHKTVTNVDEQIENIIIYRLNVRYLL